MKASEMTFEKFLASKTRCEDIGKAISADLDGLRSGWLYFDCLYIEDNEDGTYFLNIERATWSTPWLDELEMRLYIFAKDEWAHG